MNWKLVKAADFIEFNPRESIPKGAMAKKVAMDQLQPYTRDIPAYEVASFNGGSKFRNGDTLMARITPCLENGKTAQVSILENSEVGFGSTEFIVLRAKPGVSDKDFIYYLAICPLLRDKAIKSMVGSSGRQRVQQGVLNDTEFFAPPLEEQIKIGRTLRALDDKIENNTKINHHLEQIAQAIFKSWFVDFEPWGGVMPDDWREVPFGSLVQSIDNRGKTPPLAQRPTDYPIIDVKALSGSQRIIDFNNCTKFVEAETYNSWFRSVHLAPYDILLSTVGSLAEMKLFIGNRGCIAQNVVGFRSKIPLYLYQYLQYIKDDLVSYNIGSVQPSIKVTHIIKHPILVPTADVLQKFNEAVQPITEEVYTNHCQSEHLAAIRDLLLPRLISGELSISDLGDA